ncbi:hypothetical protein [Nocardia sp. NPDC051570]|uniref:hypothetical protein n=1 Tax=Nocardia sp. NPDC051570 TaxID=3364324 RepID=UPI0037874A16
MPESQPEAKGPAPVSIPPTTTSEDVGTLSIRYTDSGPVVVVTGGRRIPRRLPIVNATGARFQVLDYDVLPKDDPMGFLVVDVDDYVQLFRSQVLGTADGDQAVVPPSV